MWTFPLKNRLLCFTFLTPAYIVVFVLFQPPPLVARLHPGAAPSPTLRLLWPRPSLHYTQLPADHRRHRTPTTAQIALTKSSCTCVHCAAGWNDSYLYCNTGLNQPDQANCMKSSVWTCRVQTGEMFQVKNSSRGKFWLSRTRPSFWLEAMMKSKPLQRPVASSWRWANSLFTWHQDLALCPWLYPVSWSIWLLTKM